MYLSFIIITLLFSLLNPLSFVLQIEQCYEAFGVSFDSSIYVCCNVIVCVCGARLRLSLEKSVLFEMEMSIMIFQVSLTRMLLSLLC